MRIAAAALLAAAASSAAAQDKLPLVKVVATGGTIANTPSGRLNAAEVADAIPALKKVARLEVEEVIRVGSSAITLENWLDARAPHQRHPRARERGQRRGGHARLEHRRGDRLFPQPDGEERQAGGSDRGAAAVHHAQLRQPEELPAGGARRGRATTPAARARWWS